MLPERIEAKIDRATVGQGCWLWTASRVHGYGSSSVGSTNWRAHRLVYTLLRGAIPEGLVIDHLCRTPRCVNPDHMEPVTVRENTRRGFAWRKKNRCRRGHEMTEQNTRLTTNKGRPVRHCRQCEYIRGDVAWPSI